MKKNKQTNLLGVFSDQDFVIPTIPLVTLSVFVIRAELEVFTSRHCFCQDDETIFEKLCATHTFKKCLFRLNILESPAHR